MRASLLLLASCLPPMPAGPPGTEPSTPPDTASTTPTVDVDTPPPTCDPVEASTEPAPEPPACARAVDHADWPGGVPLRLDATEVATGVALVLTVSGADAGDRVVFHLGGPCGFDCAAESDGACFQPADADVLGEDVADGAGNASIEVVPDATWEQRWLVLQATVEDRRALSQPLVDRVDGWWEPLLEADEIAVPLTLRNQYGWDSAWWPVRPGRVLGVTYSSEVIDNLSTLQVAADGVLQAWDALDAPARTWFVAPSRWSFQADWDYGYAVEEWDLDLQLHPLDAPVGWYPDLDGDSAGDPEGPVVLSDVPVPGASPDDRDCDDGSPSVGPFGLEACEDGVDQDCDGADRSCAGPPLDDAGTELMGADGGRPPFLANFAGFDDPLLVLPGWPPGAFPVNRVDQLAPLVALDGMPAASGDLTGDGAADLLFFDYQRIFVVAGPVSPGAGPGDAVLGCDTLLPTQQLAIADVTGDAEPDVVGGPFPYAGALGWLEGPLSSPAGGESGTFGFDGDSPGFALSDADGDGLSDLWTTGPCLYLAPLAPAGAAPAGCLQGLTRHEEASSALPATSDLDGDGRGDLVAGFGETVWLVTGPLAGDAHLADAWGRIEDAGALRWGKLAAVPDRDGDDTPEIAVSAESELWLFAAAPGVSDRSDGVRLAENELLLTATVAAGDFDGDGSGDLFFSRPGRTFADRAEVGGGAVLWGEAP